MNNGFLVIFSFFMRYFQKHKVMEQRKIIIGSIIVCALFVGVFMCAQSTVSLRQLLQVNGERTGEHYTLVWQEDFSGTQLDSTKWSFIPRKPWQPFWWMSSHRSLYDLRNGRLRLYCRRNEGLVPGDTAQYLCGGIWTNKKFTVKYGKIEVRARVYGVQGSWPAIWTINYDPQNTWGTKTYTELDLMESINREKTAHQTIHNYYVDIKKGLPHDAYHVEVPINYRKYNVYSAEILPDRVIMGVNGKTTLVYEKKNIEGQFPYGLEQMLILDMQYGGTTWVGKTDLSQLPAYMDIDWVKVYKLDTK